MRKRTGSFLPLLLLIVQGFCLTAAAQRTTINLPCGTNCTPLRIQVPHLRSTEDYKVVSLAYNPLPYVTAAPPLVYTSCLDGQDDKFFDTSFLPFRFCFYGNNYSKMVISTNGLVTFDSLNALRGSHWSLTTTSTIPGGGAGSPTTLGASCPTPGAAVLLPRAAIFGVYQDIDITKPSANKKMEYRVEGTTPNRRIVISFNEIPHYIASCAGFQTSQIVMHENTGLIDIFVGNKTVCTSHNGGLAILGIQNWARDKAVSPAGRNSTQWSESNTGYRFVPSGATSRFLRSELWDLNGNLLATTTPTDTSTTVPGLLDVKFDNLCPSSPVANYVIKTYFAGCDPGEAAEMIDSITVNRTGSLNATHTTTPSACGPNGSITVNLAAGIGVAPFRISLNGGTPQTITGQSQVFNNLTGGAYTLVLTDNSGCSQTINATVASSGTLTVSHTSTATSCSGLSDGSVTITSQNGTAPFQFSLNGGPFQASGNFTNLAPGTYFATIRDASGCVRNNYQVSVTQGTAITASYTALPPSCSGVSNGSATLTPTGVGPFSYSVNGNVYQPGTVINNLATGTYFVSIRDSRGCRLDNFQVSIPAGTTFQATLTPTAPSCAGVNNGAITILPQSGSGPYQYSVNGGTFQTGLTIGGLASGVYSVVVRDAAGCTSTPYSVTVPAGAPFTTTLTTTATSCNGASNGTITVLPPTPAAIVYQYSLNGGAFQSQAVFSGLPAGNYTVVVRDPAGCQSAPLPALIQAGPPLTVGQTVVNVSCQGSANGQATITATGTAPFQYSLNGGAFQASNLFTNLAPGPYSVSVRDALSCTGTSSFTITEPAAITAVVASQSVLCRGSASGKLTVTANGGVSPYQYSLDGATYQASNIFTVTAGNYPVYVRDASGCILQLPAQAVTEPQALSATAAATDANCTANGQVTLTAAGGTLPYEYSSGTATFQASNQFNLLQGSYTFRVRDANGCTADVPAVIGLQSDLVLTPGADARICEGSSVQLNVVSNASSYAWESAPGLSSQTIASPTASPTTTTSYVVKASLGLCSLNDTLVVNVDPAPRPNAGPDREICFGQSTQLQGSGGVVYEWSGGGQSFQTASPQVTPATSTDYSLQVTDALGCRSLQPDLVRITVTPPIQVRISADTIAAAGDSVLLRASSIGTQYLWTPSTGLNNNASPTVSALVTQDITYTVVASTPAGCRGEASITIRVYEGPELYVPTAFTPNGDGRNDRFFPFPVGVTKLNYFRVYNRWGQMIFSSQTLNQGWDGNTGGKPQPTGTYVWMAEGVTKDNKLITKKGTVTLIR